MAIIDLYAELLLNIRQVTVHAILSSSSSEKTQIELKDDQTILIIKHDGKQAQIELPCPVVKGPNLRVPSTPTRELSFRLGISTAAHFPRRDGAGSGNDIPWPASKLGPGSQIACQSCGTLLVTDVTIWKDLPSGGWADMMDFWHCHKPTTGNGNDHSVGDTKGYAAANVLGPTAGVGLVDVGHFGLAESDCTGIQRKGEQGLLACTSCREPVGDEEKREGTLRLYKWSVALQRSQGNIWETYSVQEIISAQLLALIEEQAVHRFMAYSGNIENAKNALLLWVFTPDLVYSIPAKSNQRAIKIFYKSTTIPTAILESQGNKIEELPLPDDAFRKLSAQLKISNTYLPPSARSHQAWTIGLLDR